MHMVAKLLVALGDQGGKEDMFRWNGARVCATSVVIVARGRRCELRALSLVVILILILVLPLGDWDHSYSYPQRMPEGLLPGRPPSVLSQVPVRCGSSCPAVCCPQAIEGVATNSFVC